MPNFNLDDIIELAKQGYKPADIKELIELSKSEGTKPEDKKPEDDQKKEQPKEEKPEDDQKKEQPKGKKPEDDTVDYKEKVTQLEGELQKTKELLQKLQTKNAKKDASGSEEKTDAEVFTEAMKSFM